MSRPAASEFLGSREIEELTEKYDSESMIGIRSGKPLMKHSIEDDINKLFEAIDIGNSCRGTHFRHELDNKSAMKRPIRVGPSQALGIGISEPVSLKQALRGLCISQASEMAAMKKRMSRHGTPEAGAIKKLYGSVVIKAADEAARSHDEGKPNLMKIFFLPERNSRGISDVFHETNSVPKRADEGPKLREKGEISQSSKSSTSYSEESCLSVSSHSSYRPHMSKDTGWEAVNSVRKQHKILNWSDFKLLRKIGGGDITTVYLCELIGTNHLFTAKVMDYESVMIGKKRVRAQTEKEILEILDHPFLPTLYAHFATNEFSCLVTGYCPGGDLYMLQQKQPNKQFSEKAVRFYAAEVLLALEYLHMLGIVYRGLKPENVLIKEDGHILLSDFDSSLRCPISPGPLNASSPIVKPPKKLSTPCSGSICINPSCLQLSCLPAAAKTRKMKPVAIPVPELVVKPTSLQSVSFMGMHEYMAPEIIKGEGHGSAVDWWAFGIFLYELLYSKTPFKGSNDDETASNVVSQCLDFPQFPIVAPHARDLITKLLMKAPENRLGSIKGAAEIKPHPFFDGLNWALIRHETPPESPELLQFR